MSESQSTGMQPDDTGDDRMTRLERLLAQAHERITHLEGRLAAPRAEAQPPLAVEREANPTAPVDEPAASETGAPASEEKRGSRRALLKLGGAAAAASVAAAAMAATELAHPGTAQAATINWTTAPFTSDTETYVTPTSGSYTGTTLLTVQDGTASPYAPLAASPNQAAIAGYQSFGGAGSFGVYGTATAGAGVGGAGNYGGSFSGVAAPLFLAPGVSTGAPSAGVHAKGEVYVDSAGVLWSCIQGGTPGTWVRLTGVHAGIPGGALSFLPAPIRIFDTRLGQPAPLPVTKTPLVGASTTTIQVTGTSVNGVSVPLGAVGFFGNLTVSNATGPGDLILWPHGAIQPLSSNINFVTGQTVANSIIIGLDPNGQMDLYVHVTGGDVIVDVAGYIV